MRIIRGIKGVKDIPPGQMPKWNVVEESAHRLAQAYGFKEIRIPIFEQTGPVHPEHWRGHRYCREGNVYLPRP